MSYVPIVPTVPNPPPSPRTRELAGLLTKVLEEYQKAHPATSPAEIRAAVRLAHLSSRSGNPGAPLVMSLALGLLVAGLALGLFFFNSSGDVEIRSMMPMLLVALVVFIGILFVMIKTMSR